MVRTAMVIKIFSNPEAFSMIRRLGYGRSAVVKMSAPFSASGRVETRPAAEPFFPSPGLIRTDVQLPELKLQRLLQLQEAEERLTNIRRSLLSIQHHHGSGGEGEGIITLTTAAASPQGLNHVVRRLALQRLLGHQGLPRQAVNGVVCIAAKDAFLLYNPITGDTSPWIETTVACGGGKRQVESIALGFDPQRSKHKVVCISSNVPAPEEEDSDDYKRLFVEVLTVRDRTWTTGEHKWRRLEPIDLCVRDRLAFVDGPLYLDGEIHWQNRTVSRFENILGFDVGKEEVNCAPLKPSLEDEFMESLPHIRSMLMEVDGKVAILKSMSDDQKTSSLWMCEFLSEIDEASGYVGSIEWTEEKVSIPYAYVCPGSFIEALSGTDFISIQSHDGLISYYNRKTKELVPLMVPTSPVADHFDRERIMTL